MKPDVVEVYAALRRDHPARPLPRDMEEWMILEVMRLRDEVQAERADAVAEERAAVVAWLRERWSEVLAQTPQQTARLIERGEHRPEEKKP